jgi:hypothetical protein
VQFDVTKRLSHGFLMQGGYVFGKPYTSTRYSLRAPRKETLQTGAGGDNPASPVHVFKANWVYELPFGRGRWIGSNSSGLVDRLIGGWEFDGIVRIQSGRLLDFGNVRLVGMSEKDLQKAMLQEFATTGISATAPVNISPDAERHHREHHPRLQHARDLHDRLREPRARHRPLPAPANGPDCTRPSRTATATAASGTLGNGPMYPRWDLSCGEAHAARRRTTFEFRADLLNAFNHPNFTPVISTSTNADNLPRDGRAGELEPNHPARDAFQLVEHFGQETEGRVMGAGFSPPAASAPSPSPIDNSNRLISFTGAGLDPPFRDLDTPPVHPSSASHSSKRLFLTPEGGSCSFPARGIVRRVSRGRGGLD